MNGFWRGRWAGRPRATRTPDELVRSTGGGLVRWLVLGLGLAFAALGLVGAFLPVLPTTPFLLLAAACFARSSPRFHGLLLTNRVFGPYISQWQRDHTVPLEAKRKAYGLVILTFTLSILFVDALWLRATLAGTAIALIAFLAWLPATSAPVPAAKDGGTEDGRREREPGEGE